MCPIPMTLLKSRTRKQNQGLYTYAALWSYKEMDLRALDYKEVTDATMNNQLKWVIHSGCWLTPPLWSWVKPNLCLEHMQAPPWQNHIHTYTITHTSSSQTLKTIQLQEPTVTKNTEIDDTTHRDWQDMQWKPNRSWRCNTSVDRIFPLTLDLQQTQPLPVCQQTVTWMNLMQEQSYLSPTKSLHLSCMLTVHCGLLMSSTDPHLIVVL